MQVYLSSVVIKVFTLNNIALSLLRICFYQKTPFVNFFLTKTKLLNKFHDIKIFGLKFYSVGVTHILELAVLSDI